MGYRVDEEDRGEDGMVGSDNNFPGLIQTLSSNAF